MVLARRMLSDLCGLQACLKRGLYHVVLDLDEASKRLRYGLWLSSADIQIDRLN